MGQMGQGQGGLAREEKTEVAFKTEKGKVATTKGAIVGQFLVDGEQVKGDAKAGLAELVTAAEHDASDRISRDRIPRQYHKAVKEYFANLEKKSGKKPDAKPDSPGATEPSGEKPGDAKPSPTKDGSKD